MKKEIINDTKLIAYCGLYCGACNAYLKGKCKGCIENTKASWCKIRKCCIEKSIKSCSDCNEFKEVNNCKRFNNLISKMFKLIFKSNRRACIRMIQADGYENFAKYMSINQKQSLK